MNRFLFITILFIQVLGCTSCKEKVHAHNNDTNVIFLTPMVKNAGEHCNLLIINTNGDTIAYKKEQSQITDFRQWLINGQKRYGYYLKNKDFYKPDQSYSTGYRIITDSNFKELQRITLKSHGIIDGEKFPGVDHHDFILLADNHYIVMAYYEYSPSNVPEKLKLTQNVNVVTPVIQEVKNNKVTWQWVGCEHPELYGVSVEKNTYSDTGKPADYLHANSMFIDSKDSSLIVSFRNTNQVLKLNRKGNDIIWKFGGINTDFDIPDTAKFLRQHSATLINDNKTLLLLDNGQRGVREYSRILEFDIDEKEHKVTAYRIFNIPEDFIEFGGNVEKKGERYFIGGGSAGFVHEIIPRTGVKTFDLQLEMGTYRAYRYDW